MNNLFTRKTGFWNKHKINHDPSDSYFKRLRKRQCENWYTVTPYVSEFWCTISNIPFIIVAMLYNFYPLLIVGLVSFFHHMIPLKCLRDLDVLLARCMILFVIIGYYFIFKENEFDQFLLIFYFGLVPLQLIIFDSLYKENKNRVFIHVIWHCAAAMFMYFYLKYMPRKYI